jgi:lipopolysaccharide biosynthesis regulator YciM
LSDTALLAVFLATIAGVLAGRAWAAALRRGDLRDRPSFRTSPHYTQGLHYLASGQLELAISELTKVIREDPDAVEVSQVLGNLLREAGQVERAIQVHQALLDREDLTRAERAHALICLGTDFRKAGFLDRATRTFAEVTGRDPSNLHALIEQQKLYEEQQSWTEAYQIQTRISRLRKTDDSVVLGYLQAAMGDEALRGGDRPAAEAAWKTALSLDRRVLPAYLGLADLALPKDPRRAAAYLEDAVQAVPERAYVAFDRLVKVFDALGEPSRFAALCERLIEQDLRDWRARVALARHLRALGQHDEAYGLLLRALRANPQVLLVHLELWNTLRAMGAVSPALDRYLSTAEEAIFYVDPHVCTACRYRANDVLWRCPHCHEWNTFVEERMAGR